MKRLPAAAAILVGLAGAAYPDTNEMKPTDVRTTDLPRPRGGGVAVREELDAARRVGTVAAYDLFLARHGSHKLAEIARRERARIAGDSPRQP